MIAEPAKLRGEEIAFRQSAMSNQRNQPESNKLGGLVLARQLGESIMIGDQILVEVLGLKSNTARLRIVAPRSVAVHRREVYDAIRLSPAPKAVVDDSTAAPDVAVTAAPTRLDGGLVLTRRTGQTIMIGSEVAIDVVDARPGTVRLRVIAPRSISVHRLEVYEAIHAGQP